jgi:hypothetical protein
MHPAVARFTPQFLSTTTNKIISFNYIFKIRHIAQIQAAVDPTSCFESPPPSRACPSPAGSMLRSAIV